MRTPPRFPAPVHLIARSLAAAAAFLLLVSAPPFASSLVAQHEQHPAEADDLGTVDFRVSCDVSVQDDFDRAVALLHHMMYQQARSAFEEIADRDPECAMAHWGIATTLFQPLWPARPETEARRRGWEAVQEARALGPGTDRERALLGATAAFFEDPEADEWWRADGARPCARRSLASRSRAPEGRRHRSLEIIRFCLEGQSGRRVSTWAGGDAPRQPASARQRSAQRRHASAHARHASESNLSHSSAQALQRSARMPQTPAW